MDAQNVEQNLEAINALLAQFVPMVGAGALAVRMIVKLFEKNKIPIGPFQAEIDALLAAEDAAQAFVDEFRARHASLPEAEPPIAEG